ncbi:MAG: hypothetical protein ACI9XO_002500 [Paraglaciecola sp.]|jgi:hypothetical protein
MLFRTIFIILLTLTFIYQELQKHQMAIFLGWGIVVVQPSEILQIFGKDSFCISVMMVLLLTDVTQILEKVMKA